MEQESQCVVKPRLHVEYEPLRAEDRLVWNYDGSSTYRAEGCNSDVYFHPRALSVRDPFRGGKSKTVLCETFNFDDKPGVANYRMPCSQDMEKRRSADISHQLSLSCVRRGCDQSRRLQGKSNVLEFTKGY